LAVRLLSYEWIVTSDEIPDPGALRIQCRVNGELRQDASTDALVHDVAELIAYCSQSFTLEPGDIIATGTPGGVVAVAIEGIGSLRNTCQVVG
jgi:2-keto-4-pentenoate hydratase/2-oxohepta-3-ene-1,7-dioic acid hydratase in catechol pathway